LKPQKITFSSGQLKLEGYCYYPDAEGKYPGVILCHPHPLQGGSMSAGVIRAIGTELVNQNIIAMMFNFRGVGKSQGEYGGGIDEREDARAAIYWLVSQKQIEASKIGLAGYSFGGGVGAPVACEDKTVKSMALISPALDRSFAQFLKDCKKNKLFVVGEEDDMIPPERTKALYDQSAYPKEWKSIPGANHFWVGQEKILSETVVDFFKRSL
jgi:uncharacterized protein